MIGPGCKGKQGNNPTSSLARGMFVAAVVGALSLAAVSSAGAAVTVGQIAPTTPTPTCMSPVDRVQPTVSTGMTYVVPVAGTINSWSTNAGASAGALKLKVFRPLTGTAGAYTAVGSDGPQTLTLNTVNSFPANIAVMPGDLIGLNSFSGLPNCSFVQAGDQYFRTAATSDLAVGTTETLATPVTNRRLNIQAVISPANGLRFGKPKPNKKKGIVLLKVTVPNAGKLSYSGKQVKITGPTTIAAPRVITVKLRAKGKKNKALNRIGKVKVKPFFRFIPTDGVANTQSQKVILKKK